MFSVDGDGNSERLSNTPQFQARFQSELNDFESAEVRSDITDGDDNAEDIAYDNGNYQVVTFPDKLTA